MLKTPIPKIISFAGTKQCGTDNTWETAYQIEDGKIVKAISYQGDPILRKVKVIAM